MPEGDRIDGAVLIGYQAAGLCVLPARWPAKRPAVSTWKAYQAKLPTAAEVAAWFANPHQACCLICGAVSGNLELLDFDCAGEAFAAWSKLVAAEAPGLLDRLVVESSPSGGWHVVYRAAEAVCGSVKLAQRQEIVAGSTEVVRFGKVCRPRRDRDGQWRITLTLIETRGEGGLFLCAPTPGYQLVQGLFTILPVLTTAERDVLLRCAWSLTEVVPEVHDPQPAASVGLRPGDDFNARADVAALLQHHGWSLYQDGPNQHWSRPGKSTGTSATLKDGTFYVFSSNADPFAPNRAYSPFAVYALLEHHGDYAAAARELRRLGFGDQTPSTVPAAIATAEDPPEAETLDPGLLPADLLRVPGFISQVMDFTLATAPYPEPTLAFCGALSLLATLAGRKVCDPGNVRTNLYCLALANSGTGKDHPRKVNERVLLESGLIGAVGDNFASGEGIEDAMVVQPTLLFQTDEIDGMLLAIAKSRDGRAERIMEMLLKFYSAANQHYHCRVKAGTERQSIDQPCLVLFGTAVPKHYYEALCEKMLSNGFFARMLVFEAGPRGQGQEAVIRPLPESVVRTARWWTAFQPGGPGNLGAQHPTPAIVPLAADAEVAAAEVRAAGDAAYAQAQAADDTIGMAVWARATEKARKLALLHAISTDHEHPRITAEAIRWGWNVARHLTQRMLFMAGAHVFDSDFDALCKRMTVILQGWAARHGDAWMEAWKVARRMKLSVRALDEVRDALVAQRRIQYQETPTGGTPQRMFRLVVEGPAMGTHRPDQQVPSASSSLHDPAAGPPVAVNR